MGSIRRRMDTGHLFFDFIHEGIRCREQSTLTDTRENRRRMEKLLERIEAEIRLGKFDYGRYFPNSPRAARFKALAQQAAGAAPSSAFSAFAEEWFLESAPGWKRSYRRTVRTNLDLYLLPRFGEDLVVNIGRPEILRFRAELADGKGAGLASTLSADRINHLMTSLRQILQEAALRFEFPDPWVRIKPLPVPRQEIEPFTLDEIHLFLETVRGDFRDYYIVRFFTGLRTGEIDGLRWDCVDLDNASLRVKETLVDGEAETPKTRASYRVVTLSAQVVAALEHQHRATGNLGGFVFCNRLGRPLDHRNVTKRIWYPTLIAAGLKPRRPYQTRHTTATLWLAAGENPEWIARQLGHVNTRMLFETYSQYVPNLTRRDGSAFERLLQNELHIGAEPSNSLTSLAALLGGSSQVEGDIPPAVSAPTSHAGTHRRPEGDHDDR